MAKKALRHAGEGFSRQVNLFVRPEVFKAIKAKAILDDVTLQVEVDRALSAWLNLPAHVAPAEPAAAS